MTREEEAKAVLTKHFADTSRRSINAMLEYGQQRADAEAAAMRERAAGVCDQAHEDAADGSPIWATDLAAAIRALPATGEVGRG